MLSDNNTVLPVKILAGIIGIYFTICMYGMIRPAFPDVLEFSTFLQVFAISIAHLTGIYILICELFQGKE